MPNITNRLRSAARHAYAIRPDGTVPGAGAEAPPPVGYTANPVAFTAGSNNIDAGFVAAIPEGVVISIRGTTSLESQPDPTQFVTDWIHNTAALLIPAGGNPPGFPGKVHTGFYQSFMGLWQKMWPAVSAAVAAHPVKAIFVTGHSKGAAICPLIAWRLTRDIQAGVLAGGPVQVRTFAAARTGDPAFAAAYNAMVTDHVRYEYDDDLVPHLPVEMALAAAIGVPGLIATYLSAVDAGYGDAGTLAYFSRTIPVANAQPRSDALTESRFNALIARIATIPDGPAQVLACHDIKLPGSGYVAANYPR